MSDVNDCLEQSAEQCCEQSHKDVLNSINIEESMHVVRSLIHTTPSLSEDNTKSSLPQVWNGNVLNVCMHPFAMEMAAILVHNLCTKMAAMAVAKL